MHKAQVASKKVSRQEALFFTSNQRLTTLPNFSLRNRIFLSYFVLIASVIGVIGSVTVRQIREVSTEGFQDSFYEHQDTVIGTVEDLIFEEMEEGFVEAIWHGELAAHATNFEIVIELIELDGLTRYYHSENGFDDFEIEYAPEIRRLIRTGDEQEENNEDDQILSIVQIIYFEDEPQLIVRISESYGYVNNEIQRQTWTLIISSIVGGVILLLLLGSWLANGLTRPLTNLRATAQEMAAGQLDIRAETNAPSEIQLLAQDFNQMASAVESMVSEQRAFASNAAHELRTPLTGIRLRLETLLEDDPDEALMQRYLTEIDDEVGRLSRLVQDLRVLSHSDAQQLQIGTSEVQVGRLLNALEYEFAPQVAEKHLQYTMLISADPPPITASNNHIRTILRNLIENAIKYTPEYGSVQVSLTQETHNLVVKVVDNGMGISAENLPKLFNRFYRVDPARNRKIAGSGLGLSLAQSIAALYGGEITITSAGLGKGSTAQLTLPLDTPNAA